MNNKLINAAAAIVLILHIVLPIVILANIIKIKRAVLENPQAPPAQHEARELNQDTEQLIKQFKEEGRKQDEKIQELLKQAEQ